jgi:hypothetical protein
MSNAAIHQSLAEAQAQRQADFGRYMDRFSDVFGDELFAVHSAEANVEVTQLLADCIEAGWVVWGAEPDLAVHAQDGAAVDGAAGSVVAEAAMQSADAAFQALAVSNGVAAAPSAPGNAASATAAATVASVSAKTASATKEGAASPAPQQNQRPHSSRGAKTPK